jgi:pimeloyl-ACP methyl ester carboxylesterase
METRVQTVEECRQLLADQMPFHFADPEGEPYRVFLEAATRHMELSPHVVRTFASSDQGVIDVEDRLPEIDVPVLVLAAEFDRVTVPEGGWSIAEAVPQGECVLLKDAGHMMFVEKPEVVRRSIEVFFDRFPPSS